MKAIVVDKQASLKSHADCIPKLLGTLTLAAVFSLMSVQGLGMETNPAKVVTYSAPDGESLCADYEVQAEGQTVDVYTARVLDAPFAGKQWET